MKSRQHDLVVFGATGYLGPQLARYLAATAPNTLRWTIAGRNQTKLQKLQDELHAEYPARKPPSIIAATLSPSDLDNLASSTRLIINLVGPFSKHGTPVVHACIRQSTAYIDSTGEHTWSHEIATKLHDEALAQHSPIIPHCAVESAPPDLMTHLLLKKAHQASLVPTSPVYFSIEHTWPGYSGGTVAAILGVLETYSLAQMNASSAPLASCVHDAGPNTPPEVPIMPVRSDTFLGGLTFNPSAMTDRAVVMRTWSLLQKYGKYEEKYGQRFIFQGYARTSSLVKGWLSFLGTSLMTLFVVLLPPLQRLLAWISPEPGTGPQIAKDEKRFVEWRAVMQASSTGELGASRRVTGVMRMERDPYSCCTVLVAEAALSALEVLESDDGSLLGRLKGGVLTPASIGETYIRRLERAGLITHIEVGSPSKNSLA